MTENIQDNAFLQLKKNTVDAANQLKDSECVRFFNRDGAGKRIMFVGNSITLHGVNVDIGWPNEWGMAASSKEKDYAHVLMSEINKTEKDAAFCICQVSAWEKNYKLGKDAYNTFFDAPQFNPDIIVARLIENCPGKDFDPEVFKKNLEELLRFLANGKPAKVILTTGFWHHPGDKALIEFSKEKQIPLVELGDLGEMDEMKAIGLFQHAGVANHPGDLGMKNIAHRIFDVLKSYL